MKLTVVIVTFILMTLVDEGATWGSWRAPRIRVHRIRVPPILKKICNPVFVQPHVYTIPNVPFVDQSVHTGAIKQFANGLDEKEANLK